MILLIGSKRPDAFLGGAGASRISPVKLLPDDLRLERAQDAQKLALLLLRHLELV